MTNAFIKSIPFLLQHFLPYYPSFIGVSSCTSCPSDTRLSKYLNSYKELSYFNISSKASITT
jgi:hypothetical protein